MKLVLGLLLMLIGSVWGGAHWIGSIVSGDEATTGTVMLAVLPLIMGFQLLLSAIDYDMTHAPQAAIAALVFHARGVRSCTRRKKR